MNALEAIKDFVFTNKLLLAIQKEKDKTTCSDRMHILNKWENNCRQRLIELKNKLEQTDIK